MKNLQKCGRLFILYGVLMLFGALIIVPKLTSLIQLVSLLVSLIFMFVFGIALTKGLAWAKKPALVLISYLLANHIGICLMGVSEVSFLQLAFYGLLLWYVIKGWDETHSLEEPQVGSLE